MAKNREKHSIRKRIMPYVLAGALLIGGFISYKLLNRYEEGQRFGGEVRENRESFESFPKNIPGIRAVDKCYEKDSRNTIVHVRQVHRTGFEERIGYDHPDRKNCQAEIYQALSFLADGRSLTNVYREGIDAELKSKSDKIRELVKCAEELVSQYNEIALTDPSQRALRDKLIEENRKLVKIVDKCKEDLESVGRLYFEGKISILDGERPEFAAANEKWHEDIQAKLNAATDVSDLRRILKESAIFDPVYNDKRQDALIELVHKHVRDGSDNSRVHLAVYGGLHNFSDNVSRWNKEHPRDKFSLIVLTPISYKEDRASPH